MNSDNYTMTAKKYLIFFNYPWLKFGIRWPNGWAFPRPIFWRVLGNVLCFALGWFLARIVYLALCLLFP